MKNSRLVFLLLITIVCLPPGLFAETNPFKENSKITLENSAISIQDVATAEAAQMIIRDGFPVDGTVSCKGSTLRLRSWPWGDVVESFPDGTAIKVIGESGEFFLVEVGGKQGYMHRNYVSIPQKTASEEEPFYPGDTASGGALSLAEGVKVSKTAAAGTTATSTKTATATKESAPAGSSTSGSQTQKVTSGSNGKVVINVPQKCQMQVNCPAPGSACGPTSLAMILGHYTGKNVDSLATSLWTVCGSTAASGTGHEGLKKGAAKYGYTNAKWHYCVSQSWVREQIKSGKPILAHVKGHYVVIKGIDNSGTIYFNDPGRSKVDRSMSFAEFSAWWCGAGSKHPCMLLE